MWEGRVLESDFFRLGEYWQLRSLIIRNLDSARQGLAWVISNMSLNAVFRENWLH